MQVEEYNAEMIFSYFWTNFGPKLIFKDILLPQYYKGLLFKFQTDIVITGPKFTIYVKGFFYWISRDWGYSGGLLGFNSELSKRSLMNEGERLRGLNKPVHLP